MSVTRRGHFYGSIQPYQRLLVSKIGITPVCDLTFINSENQYVSNRSSELAGMFVVGRESSEPIRLLITATMSMSMTYDEQFRDENICTTFYDASKVPNPVLFEDQTTADFATLRTYDIVHQALPYYKTKFNWQISSIIEVDRHAIIYPFVKMLHSDVPRRLFQFDLSIIDISRTDDDELIVNR